MSARIVPFSRKQLRSGAERTIDVVLCERPIVAVAFFQDGRQIRNVTFGIGPELDTLEQALRLVRDPSVVGDQVVGVLQRTPSFEVWVRVRRNEGRAPMVGFRGRLSGGEWRGKETVIKETELDALEHAAAYLTEIAATRARFEHGDERHQDRRGTTPPRP